MAAGDKPEVLTDFLEQTKKNHAEAEKRRYHALPAEEKLKKSRQRQQKQREDVSLLLLSNGDGLF